MELFDKMGVWAERLPHHAAKARGGTIIKGRCIGTSNGDSTKPDCRATFVGKEYEVGVGPTLYATDPPLEALKLLPAHASSRRGKGVHVSPASMRVLQRQGQARTLR